jgi:hypothetical protein
MRFEMAAELRLTAETPAVGDFPNGFTAARVLQVSERRFQPQRPDPLSDGSVASFEELVQVAAGNAVGEGNVLDRHRAIGEILADIALDTREVSEAHGAHAAAERSVSSSSARHSNSTKHCPNPSLATAPSCSIRRGMPRAVSRNSAPAPRLES